MIWAQKMFHHKNDPATNEAKESWKEVSEWDRMQSGLNSH